MNFAADPIELIRILRPFYNPDEESGDAISVSADDYKFIVKNRFTQNATVAMIFESGRCEIAYHNIGRLFAALKKRVGRKKAPENILVEITDNHIKLGGVFIVWKSKAQDVVKKPQQRPLLSKATPSQPPFDLDRLPKQRTPSKSSAYIVVAIILLLLILFVIFRR